MPSNTHQDLEDEEFAFEACEIPGAHEWHFAIDEKGVFQVYESPEGRYPMLRLGMPALITHCSGEIESPGIRRTKHPRVFRRSREGARRNMRWSDKELRLPEAQLLGEQVHNVFAPQRAARACGDEASASSVLLIRATIGYVSLNIYTVTSTTSAKSTRTSITRAA